MKLRLERLESPIGTVLIASDGEAVRAIDFLDAGQRWDRALRLSCGNYELAESAEEKFANRLAAYFAGDLAAIDSIPVETGGTAFQRLVWAALRRIPLGTTTSYGALARAIGRPRAIRAVGAANGANPVSIVVPCHRVVGADRSLTGYGGGLTRKAWLLGHERAVEGRRPTARGGSAG